MQTQSNMTSTTQIPPASTGFQVARLTEKGLVVKGCDKIDKIIGELNLVDVKIHSWQLGRVIRRDYYLITNNLFFNLRRGNGVTRIREALTQLSEEADVLENMARRFEEKLPKEGIDPVQMRVVSDEAEILLSALTRVDYAVSKLLLSDLAELIEENLRPFYAAYDHLKYQIIGQSPASRSQKEAEKNNS